MSQIWLHPRLRVLVLLLLTLSVNFAFLDAKAQSSAPTIESFSPTVGGDGTRIIVKGMFFGANVEKITVGGVPVKDVYFDYFVGYRITVGAGATGPIIFHTRDTVVVSKQIFEYVSKPVISGFQPSTGKTGTVITIRGKHFHNTSRVFFGESMASSVQVISDTVLSAVVATGSSGNVEVQTAGGKISLPGFIYTASPPPVVAVITPISGKPGSVVEISGSNFGDDPTVVHVRFGTAYGKILSVASSKITVASPAGTKFGVVEITVNGYVVVSRQSFTLQSQYKGTISDTTFRHIKKLDSANTYRRSLRFTDFDGDGKVDLLTDFPGIGYKVLRNASTNDSFSFHQPTIVSLISNLWDLALADFDGDGKTDLAGSAGNKTVAVRNSSQPGAMRFEDAFTEDNSNKELFIATDLNGDGKTDIAQSDLNWIYILRNNSAGSSIDFKKNGRSFLMKERSSRFDIADLDADGKPELILQKSLVDSPAVSLIIHKNITIGDTVSFEEGKYFYGGGAPKTLRFADLNNDRKIDMIIHNAEGIDYVENKSQPGSMSFAAPVNIIKDNAIQDFDIADINGDGLPDLISIRMQDSVFRFSENKTINNIIRFANPAQHPLAFKAVRLLVQDLNDSGYPELITLNDNGDISVYSADRLQPQVPTCVARVNVLRLTDSACLGKQLSFIAAVNGEVANPGFQWLVNNRLVGETGKVFRSGLLKSGDKITVIMIAANACGNIRDTSVTLNVGIIADAVRPSISIEGKTELNYGEITTVKATVLNPGRQLQFSWYDSTRLGNWQKIPAANQAFINYSPMNTGDQLRCVVISTDSCGNKDTISDRVWFTMSHQMIPYPNLPMRAYPNPVSGILNIENINPSDNWQSLTVFGANGQLLLSMPDIRNRTTLRISLLRLAAGTYFIRLMRITGERTYLKIVKI